MMIRTRLKCSFLIVATIFFLGIICIVSREGLKGLCTIMFSSNYFSNNIVNGSLLKSRMSKFACNETLVNTTIQGLRLSKCLQHTGNSTLCNLVDGCNSGFSGGRRSLCRKRLPGCLIIGAYKSGTRELVDFLQINPYVVARTAPFYEVSFFDKHFHKGFSWYVKEMPRSFPDQITIEKSPNYFQSSEAPSRIFKANPHMKLLLMVREPVERAVSHFTFDSYVARRRYGGQLENCAFNPTKMEVNQHCFAIKHSVYNSSFVHYLKYFKRDQIFTIDADEFQIQPWHVLNQVESFLNIPRTITPSDFVWNQDKNYYCVRSDGEYLGACYDLTRGRKSQKLLTHMRDKLKTYFKPYNDHFFTLIDRKLNW